MAIAYVLINCVLGSEESVRSEIEKIPDVKETCCTFGAYDILEKFESDKEQIGNEIGSANKNITSAKNMLRIEEWGWAHTAAYTVMFHAGRALMFSKGYRPKGRDHHVAVVSFIQAVFSYFQI